MTGYFRPLRRKVGLITLVFACVLMVGWIKSRKSVAFIGFYSATQTARTVVSVDGLLGLQTFQRGSNKWMPNSPILKDWKMISSDLNLNDVPPSPSYVYWGYADRLLSFNPREIPNYIQVGSAAHNFSYPPSWTHYRGLVHLGVYHRDNSGDQFTAVLFPYWFVVIPLTLLSAWLLLSKPPSKPAANQSTLDATLDQNTHDAI